MVGGKKEQVATTFLLFVFSISTYTCTLDEIHVTMSCLFHTIF